MQFDMKNKLFVLFLLAGLFLVQQANAQTTIGFTNPAKVLNQLPEVQEVDQQIQKLITEKDEELAAKASNLQEMFSEYENARASMTEEQRTAREDELMELNQQFQTERENGLKEVQQRRRELMAPIIQRMNTAMEEVAAEMNLDLVLNEGTSYGDSIIFYGKDKLDITDKIIAKLQ
ncbi:MAG: OmpH family outer membrane protein [Balneolaceae bacterium]|nr:OmpH family outer membrane protein [Balneolaceae bacterium]